jgi:hypothetical protein
MPTSVTPCSNPPSISQSCHSNSSSEITARCGFGSISVIMALSTELDVWLKTVEEKAKESNVNNRHMGKCLEYMAGLVILGFMVFLFYL